MTDRVFRLLLLLYPAAFRAEYESEMRADFAVRRRSSSAVVFWLDAIFDTLVNAAAAHLDMFKQDARWAVRSFAKTPGFTAAAISVAALGIGATAAVFTLADHVLIRPLPFREPDQLAKVWESTPIYGRLEPSPANYRDWSKMDPPFEELAAARMLQVNISGQGEPRMLDAAALTANMLPMLGVQPVIGRGFTAEDDRADTPLTVLLSYGEWRDHHGADPSVIGRKLLIDGKAAEVIGVLPPWFRYPTQRANLWMPMRFTPDDFADRTNTFLLVLGRIKHGLPLSQARARMDVIASQLEHQYPVDNAKVGVRVYLLKNEIPEQSRMLLYALAGAAGGLLLIACVNLANLMLARANSRRRELAIRTSLGAGRERLTRQLMTESLLLCIAGGAAGTTLGFALMPLLARLVPTMLPLPPTPKPDIRVWLICLALTLITGFGFGLFPALIASRDSAGGLREGGRSGHTRRNAGIRSLLVVCEVSACVALLASTGLLLRALWKVHAADLGFAVEHRVALRTTLPMPKYETVARREAFYTKILSDVTRLPGVRAAAYTSFLPVAMGGGIWEVKLPGETHDKALARSASLRFITDDYFRTMGIPVLEGRGPTGVDLQNSLPVAVVSQSFVDQYLGARGGGPVLGRTFEIAFKIRTIVGVVGSVRTRGYERASEPQVYLPFRQIPDGWMPFYAPKDLVIDTADAAGTLRAVRTIIAGADPEQPVSMVETLAELVATDTEGRTTQIRVLGAFAAAALILAAIGIHGLLAFGVSERRKEIGVRMALGALPGAIVKLIAGEGAKLGLAGVTIGIILAAIAGKGLESLLAGVSPLDAVSFGAAAAICAFATVVGSIGPVMRAVRIDPVESIRAD